MIGFQVAAALLLAAVVLWAVLAPLFRPAAPAAADPLDALVDPLETPKGQALAALRELEFDRATGKLSQADYAQLTAKYSAEALRLQREEDTARGRSRPEHPAGARRGEVPAPACPTCGPRPESDALFCSSCGTRLAEAEGCPSCGTALAPGARFCSECGTPAPARAGA